MLHFGLGFCSLPLTTTDGAVKSKIQRRVILTRANQLECVHRVLYRLRPGDVVDSDERKDISVHYRLYHQARWPADDLHFDSKNRRLGDSETGAFGITGLISTHR